MTRTLPFWDDWALGPELRTIPQRLGELMYGGVLSREDLHAERGKWTGLKSLIDSFEVSAHDDGYTNKPIAPTDRVSGLGALVVVEIEVARPTYSISALLF
ncbi:hypothetical protein VUR80DRAFT_9687 [Thermomyces stellatus]